MSVDVERGIRVQSPDLRLISQRSSCGRYRIHPKDTMKDETGEIDLVPTQIRYDRSARARRSSGARLQLKRGCSGCDEHSHKTHTSSSSSSSRAVRAEIVGFEDPRQRSRRLRMGLFRSRGGASRSSSTDVLREPIQGNRSVNWDRASTSHSRQASSVPSGFLMNNHTPGTATDSIMQQGRAHSRQFSSADRSITSQRRSLQTDTTSRSLDPDARSVRVRKSDVFSSRPSLKFDSDVQYRPMPDGHLPTLRGPQKSAFVDQLADELNTHELRSVMDTDSRRRKRRQSALPSSRRQERLISSRFVTEPVETTIISPVTTAHIRIERDASAEISERTAYASNNNNNPITGTPDDWHEAGSFTTSPALMKDDPIQAEILLAGNRESFPDFAVVDRRNGIAQSNNNGFLTSAWGSLWRRASTARTKKENDVAQHRTKTLALVNKDERDEAPTPTALRQLTYGQEYDDRERPFSTSSSVLYETLEDLPQVTTIQQQQQQQQPYSTGHARQQSREEVPMDAFYDPIASTRPASRATHSRNFSRPTNDSRLGQYSRASNHPAVASPQSQEPQFSPLMDGGAFPRPEQRALPDHLVSSGRNGLIVGPNSPARNPYSVDLLLGQQQGFSTPAQAAGLAPIPQTSPTLPVTSEMVRDGQRGYVPSRALNFDENQSPPTTAPLPKEPLSARSVHSLQSLDSEGSWLTNRRSDIDDVVRRSFSRNADERPRSIDGASYRRQTKRPLSSRSQLRPIITDGISIDEASDAEDSPTIDDDDDDEEEEEEDRDTEEHLVSPSSHELEDEVEYEQGIWRTGIGKSVHVVNSPLRGQDGRGPVIVDRSELGAAVESHRTSEERAPTPTNLPAGRPDTDGYLHGGPRPAGQARTASSPTLARSRPAQMMQHESFMTSVNSFYTADGYPDTLSAASSRATLTDVGGRWDSP